MLNTDKEPEQKANLPEIAYQGIRQMLFNNDICPGQKISYRDLARKLNMSPTPVSQALKRLEHQGLVHHETNRGYCTAPMRAQEVEELFELRELIEISLLPRIIDNISNASLRQLEKIMEMNKTSSEEERVNQRLLTDRKFHLAMAQISGRVTQIQILEHLFDLLYIKYRASLLFAASKRSVGYLHQDLITALGKRNLAACKKIMETHFQSIKKYAVDAGLHE